jgi:type II secretory pathway pseudopilin PulG
MNASPRQHPAGRHAFTLVEAVMGCVLVALVLVPTLQLIGDSSRSRATQTELSRASGLARELLGEILQARYLDPNGVTTGQTRANFDDVSDYNGLTESPPVQRSGTTITGFTGWRRATTVRLVSPSAPTTTSATDQGLKEIVVTVTSDTGKTYSFTALKGKNDATERRPGSSGSHVTSVDISLDVGAGAPLTTSINTANVLR